MYTEYIYINKQYEIIDRNIKALLFDVVTKEQRELINLKEKAAATSELKEQIVRLCEDRDNCLKNLLALADNLSSTLQSLDSCARDFNYLENKNIAMLVANVHENKENVSETEIETKNDSEAEEEYQHDNVDDNDEKSIEEKVPEEATVSNSDNAQTNEENEVKQSDSTPVVDISSIDSNSDNESQLDVVSKADLSGDGTAQIDSNIEQEQSQYDNSILEQAQPQADTPVIQIPVVSENTHVVFEENEKGSAPVIPQTIEPGTVSAVPETIEQSTTPVTQITTIPSEQQLIEDQSVSQQSTETIPTIMTASADESNSSNVGSNLYSMIYFKNDIVPPKAILTTGKQVAKLRESKSNQSSILSALGFFSNSVGSQTFVDEQQMINNGSVPTTVEDSQHKIEEMMNRANELYKAGNIEESQNLYNQISQLNNSLKESSVATVR